MNNIKVLVLAGGDSSRFWPLADKHSLKFLDKYLGYYCLSSLAKFGLTEVIVVVNKKNKLAFEALKREFTNLNIILVEQTDTRGMAGAIISCANYIKGSPIVVVGPSDIYEEILVANFVDLLKTNPDGVLTGITVDGYFPGGYLSVNKDLVTRIVEKPSPTELPSNIVSFVFHYFKNADLILSAIERVKSIKDDVYEKAIELLIDTGVKFKYLPYSGFWGYLKHPWQLLNMSDYFLDKIKDKKIKSNMIAKSASIKGSVWIDADVKILEGAMIIGPAFIGKGSVIGQNSLIRESMIGRGCVIGYSSEIVRSFIGDNCWFHMNYVGDSVVSDNVSLGAGAIFANFRLDESVIKSTIAGKKIETGRTKLGAIVGTDTRIGANSTIMPGIKIGKNSIVGAGVILDVDLDDNKFCVLGSKKYIVKNNKLSISSSLRAGAVSKL